MRVNLIDIDSKMPNLALMKLSAYHKAKCDVVGFNVANPDKVYCSVIFTKNAATARGITRMYDCPVEFGGSGIDLFDLHKISY